MGRKRARRIVSEHAGIAGARGLYLNNDFSLAEDSRPLRCRFQHLVSELLPEYNPKGAECVQVTQRENSEEVNYTAFLPYRRDTPTLGFAHLDLVRLKERFLADTFLTTETTGVIVEKDAILYEIWNTNIQEEVVVVAVEIIKLYLIQPGRFLAATGYVAPSPNHVQTSRKFGAKSYDGIRIDRDSVM